MAILEQDSCVVGRRIRKHDLRIDRTRSWSFCSLDRIIECLQDVFVNLNCAIFSYENLALAPNGTVFEDLLDGVYRFVLYAATTPVILVYRSP